MRIIAALVVILALTACKPPAAFCDRFDGQHRLCPVVDTFPDPQP